VDIKEVEAAIEGILFAAGEPVGVERICMALEVDRATVDAVCQKLADDYSYERRGIRLIRLDSCYQLCSAPEFAAYIRKAFESRKPARLSQPALEVLSIIAYNQPTTKAYVDQIRGVDSAYTVGLLTERELIEECGRLAVPGRPILYRTTQNFLRSFGLSSLEELPDLPSASAEDEQITLDMQMQVEELQKKETAQAGEEITDEELSAAAQALAAQESEEPVPEPETAPAENPSPQDAPSPDAAPAAEPDPSPEDNLPEEDGLPGNDSSSPEGSDT